MIAGAGLNQREVVELTVREGPDRLRELVALGAEFNRRGDGEFDLTREGGHSQAAHRARRRHHRARGRARAARGLRRDRPNIAVLRGPTAIDLILDQAATARARPVRWAPTCCATTASIDTFLGKVTVLATGGAGKVYLYTTNPDVATGDGVAMAYRAGREDREHGVLPVPPHLPLPPARRRTSSSARRCAARAGGCGSRSTGERFMKRYDPRRSSRRATSWPAPSTPRSSAPATSACTST